MSPVEKRRTSIPLTSHSLYSRKRRSRPDTSLLSDNTKRTRFRFQDLIESSKKAFFETSALHFPSPTPIQQPYIARQLFSQAFLQPARTSVRESSMVHLPFSSPARGLSAQKELDLAKFYLENASKDTDKDIVLALCDDAEAALTRTKKIAKKALNTPQSEADQTLRDGFVNACLEHAELVVHLGYAEKAQTSRRRAERLGQPSLTKGTGTKGPYAWKKHRVDKAHIPDTIFPDDHCKPPVEIKLPEPDQRLVDTAQLVYCLGLLKTQLGPEEDFDPSVKNWVKETEKEEKDRLIKLTTEIVKAFIREELKDEKVVTEVSGLAPVLEKEEFRGLLMPFVNSLDQSVLLNHSLEGVANMMKGASPGYLDSGDLVDILKIINTRLQSTHGDAVDNIYRLTSAASNVLDAMADTEVKGVNRVKLHEPLDAYFRGQQHSKDPYMVYQAAYAFQALQWVSDDESPWQATKRRTGILVKGVSGMVSAVKGLDISGFITGLEHLQEGMEEVIAVAKVGYEGVSSLVEGGQGLVEALQNGLCFSKQRPWYKALRGTDTVLQDGELAKFKTLVCEAPCRLDIAFQLGVCQRLGNLAANEYWDLTHRQGAVAFLGEIYRNDNDWKEYALVKQWILHILMNLASEFNSTLPGVETLLDELRTNGDEKKRALYRGCREDSKSSYPLKIIKKADPLPGSLLDRVQNKPDVEADLRRLRKQQTKDEGNVYIAPQAKANLQAADDTFFDLTKHVDNFLNSQQDKVMLLLGDSGVGKSTFNRAVERDLWKKYIPETGRIPLLINLPGIDKPQQDLIAKHLRRNDFDEPQIRELKDNRKFVLICDGYDESQQMQNLYITNQLNEEGAGQWRAQMIISCRSEYLPQDYRHRFEPTEGGLQEAVMTPFTPGQIEEYVKIYVKQTMATWRAQQYMTALNGIPNLLDLVKNPFLLTLSLDVLPRIMDPDQDVSNAKITRIALYDQFMDNWLEHGKKRIGDKKPLTGETKKAFERLTDEGFTQNGIIFMKDLAAKIYRNQAGTPVVDYSHKRDKENWKGEFFNRDEENQLLLEACPIVRNGSQYRFFHRSLLEYSFTRAVFEPQETKTILDQPGTQGRRMSVGSVLSFEDPIVTEETSKPDLPAEEHPLTWRSLVGEHSILQFLAERVQQESAFKKELLALIERSKREHEIRKAAANAITILVRAGVQFNGKDLKGIKIPGADLSGGQFDSAQLQGADLRSTKLRNVWLNRADLSRARMSDVAFGEWPFLEERWNVTCCTYSAKGKSLAVSTGVDLQSVISVYDTSTYVKTHTLQGHTEDIRDVLFSHDDHQIASCSKDATVRLWDARDGTPSHILSDHTGDVFAIAYSPNSDQIASASDDTTVRLWDTQTGAPGPILRGHTGGVTSVVYSPDGQRIASGSLDDTVRLWDAKTGVQDRQLSGHTDGVLSVAFSVNGEQIASCSKDSTVRLWDVQTGETTHVLKGHTGLVIRVAYSPNLNRPQIASASYEDDFTVRLWDTKSGAPLHVLSGHIRSINRLAFSPRGLLVASCSDDGTVRLWDTKTGASVSVFGGHDTPVRTVSYSPDGKQIASGGHDHKVRLWNPQVSVDGPTLSGHVLPVRDVTFCSEGKLIASCSDDNTVRLWDAETGAPRNVLKDHTNKVGIVVCSPDGEQIASSSEDLTVRLWNVKTGAKLYVLRGHTGDLIKLAYSPKGEQIAAGSRDSTVRLWDTKTGEVGPVLSGHADCVWGLAYAPVDQQIASGSDDSTIRLWNTQTGAAGRVLIGHSGGVRCLAYSLDGQQLVSASLDATVRVWDVNTGALIHNFSDHSGPTWAVAYSPDGKQIASCSTDDTVRLWDAQTGASGPVLKGHNCNKTLSAAYSPSGKLIVSTSHDNTVRLWDAKSGESLFVLNVYQGVVTSLTWNASNDETFVTGCSDNSIRVWDVEKDGRQVSLKWATTFDRLCVTEASIQSVHGLGRINKRLLEQGGAVGKPVPPITFQAATKKVMFITSVTSKFKAPSKKTVADAIPKVEALAV